MFLFAPILPGVFNCLERKVPLQAFIRFRPYRILLAGRGLASDDSWAAKSEKLAKFVRGLEDTFINARVTRYLFMMYSDERLMIGAADAMGGMGCGYFDIVHGPAGGCGLACCRRQDGFLRLTWTRRPHRPFRTPRSENAAHYHWPLARRPGDHPSLSYSGLRGGPALPLLLVGQRG